MEPGSAPSRSSPAAALGTMLACVAPAAAPGSASDSAFSTSTSAAPQLSV